MRQLIHFRVSEKLKDACIAMDKAIDPIVFEMEMLINLEMDITWDLHEIIHAEYYPMEVVNNLYIHLGKLLGLFLKKPWINSITEPKKKVLWSHCIDIRSIIREDCEYFNKHQNTLLLSP